MFANAWRHLLVAHETSAQSAGESGATRTARGVVLMQILLLVWQI